MNIKRRGFLAGLAALIAAPKASLAKATTAEAETIGVATKTWGRFGTVRYAPRVAGLSVAVAPEILKDAMFDRVLDDEFQRRALEDCIEMERQMMEVIKKS